MSYGRIVLVTVKRVAYRRRRWRWTSMSNEGDKDIDVAELACSKNSNVCSVGSLMCHELK